jgi:pimeloyl-ACP methyl ester carboxylesterase
MQNYSDYWYTSSDGLGLYARQYGPDDAERTIICIPGLTRNSADFAPVCEHLAKQFRVFAVDLRGRGNSDYDSKPENYHPGTYAIDIITLLDQLSLDSAILIGTSLGGLVSIVLAATAADRVTAAVINDIGPEADEAGLARIKAYVNNAKPVSDWPEAVAKTKASLGREYPEFSDHDWQQFSENLYRENAKGVPALAYDPQIAVLLQSPGTPEATDLWPLFQLIQDLPLLLVRGELSDILSRECVAKMQQQLPDMEFLEIPNCGHAPLLSEPSALAAIDHFLSDPRLTKA